jgi:hypothetical protein
MLGKPELKIDWASHEAAKYACENWHYSKCLPAGKLVKVGAWENGKFIGVVLFGRGTCNHLAHKFGANNTNACELVRVALQKHKSPVSKIVAIALRLLRSQFPTMRLVVSFASQDEGHHGGIYQAGNWIYDGTTRPKDEFLFKGKRATDRQISQFVKDSRIGRRVWETRGVLIRLPTTPKHRYLMPLDKEMSAKIQPLAKPYPKRVKQAMTGDQPEQRRRDTDPPAPVHAENQPFAEVTNEKQETSH